MGIEHLQEFIEKECSKACQPVDLLKLSREHTQQQLQKRGAPLRGRSLQYSRFHVVVDAESCLDRLYGGYYSDWVCGGQWNRMMHFLNNMMQACHAANMELVVFFDGAVESDRIYEWYTQQIEVKKKVAQVHKHINNKGTPPPKVWWIPPVGLKSALRMVLRQFKIPIVCSLDDHHQEIIAYTRENFFHGLIGQHAVYAIFDPPRYFASEHLKLTYHNSLETTEYVVDEVARIVDLHPKRLPIVAALLGNHILTEDDLKGLYLRICQAPAQGQKNPPVEVIKAVIAFVRSLNSVDDLETLGQEIFKDEEDFAEKNLKFRQSVQYYINGTKEGFLKYKTRPKHGHKKEPGSYPGPTEEPKEEKKPPGVKKEVKEEEKSELEADKSELTEDILKADKVYTEGESGYCTTTDTTPDIVIEPPTPTATTNNNVEQKMSELSLDDNEDENAVVEKEEVADTKDDKQQKTEEEDKEDEMPEKMEDDKPKKEEKEDEEEEKPEAEKEEEMETEEKSEAEGEKPADDEETPKVMDEEKKPPLDEGKPQEAEEQLDVEQDCEVQEGKSHSVVEEEKHAMDEDDEKPHVVEEKLEAGEEKPELGEEKPEVGEEKLEVEEEKPEVEEEKPEVGEEKPEVAEEKPEVAEEKQEVAEEKQEVAEEKPKVEGKKPKAEGKTKGEEKREKQRIRPLMSLNTEMDPASLRVAMQSRRPMKLPRVPPEIMRIVCERHAKGLMMPWIYQVLTQGEIKMDVSLEDDMSNDLPNAVELYKYARQKVYAILFDLGPKRAIVKQNPSQSGEIMTDVLVREWVVPRGVGGPKGDEVPAISLEWKVPSIRRLWLGQAVEDKNRRLRALLTCMMSDVSLMLNVSYVPQHLLVLCCVLRYMLMFKDRRVLRRQELDAFLATAVSPMLIDTEANQDMKLPLVTTRGVQLAALLMHGVETAIFVNDGCGAPLPWTVTCPWNFFDGKLFHYKLLKANNNVSIVELCDGQMDQVMKVEQMRKAILEGIKMDVFVKQPFSMVPGAPQFPGSVYPSGMPFRGPGMPGGGPPGMRGGFQPPLGAGRGGVGRGRGILGHSPVDSRGGQLQIAGVVVGNWGANTHGGGGHRGGGRQSNVGPPQVTSVGPRSGRGAAGSRVVSTRARGGAGPRGRGITSPARGMPTQRVQVPTQRYYQNGPGGRGGAATGMGGPPGAASVSGRGGARFTASPRGGAMGGPGAFSQPKHVSYRDDGPRAMTQNGGIGGRGRTCTVDNMAEGGTVVSISQFISQKEVGHDLHNGSPQYGGGAAPPMQQHPQQQQLPYASSGAQVMHSMSASMSTAGMGIQAPASVGLASGALGPMQGGVMHGIMAHPHHQQQVQSMHTQGGLMHHQIPMASMHHQGAMHAHYGQGDAPPPPPPFVRGASDDDFGQFEDLSVMQINGDMGGGPGAAAHHPYVSEGVTHVVQHNGRVTVNLGTTLTD